MRDSISRASRDTHRFCALQHSPESNGPSPSGSSLGTVVGVLAGVLALALAGGGFWFYKKRQGQYVRIGGALADDEELALDAHPVSSPRQSREGERERKS